MTNVPFPYRRLTWPEGAGNESYSFECIDCHAPSTAPHQEDCHFAGFRGETAMLIVVDEMREVQE